MNSRKSQGSIRLNLGCGNDIKEGYINLDISKFKGVDVVHNLDKFPYPFPSNYFDEVYARDSIEHLKDLFKTMKEIHRICKNGAIVNIIVPYWHSSNAFYPNHHYFFNTDSMKFFTIKGYDDCRFEIKSIKLIPSRVGWLIPPIPIPRFIFSNVLDLRHLVSYFLGEIILKIDFIMRPIK